MKKETLAKLEKAGIKLDGKKVVAVKGPAARQQLEKLTDLALEACAGGPPEWTHFENALAETNIERYDVKKICKTIRDFAEDQIRLLSPV